MKNKIQALFKEMIPVTLGILIALFINNWKENIDNRKFINTAMAAITEELSENREEIKGIIIEHLELSDTIEYYKEDEDVAVGGIINKVKGVRGINIKNTAWKTFLNSRIDLIEYEKISILSSIDEDKYNMQMKMEKLTDFLYKEISSAEYIDKELFQIIVNDLLYSEEELLKSHEEFMSFRE